MSARPVLLSVVALIACGAIFGVSTLGMSRPAEVDGEVRKLAERSQVHTREIGELARNSVELARTASTPVGKIEPESVAAAPAAHGRTAESWDARGSRETPGARRAA